jgi:hypothetical protein
MTPAFVDQHVHPAVEAVSMPPAQVLHRERTGGDDSEVVSSIEEEP